MALVFDLNFHEQCCSIDDAGSLCRQLTMSYAANKKAARPFPLLLLGGVGVPLEATQQLPPEPEPEPEPEVEPEAGGGKKPKKKLGLVDMLQNGGHNWWSQPGVRRSSSAAPWEDVPPPSADSAGPGPRSVVYLSADSPNILSEHEGAADPGSDSVVYVVGGIVDRVDKPGLSYGRAVAAGLQTARLPLERYVKFHKQAGRRESGDDVTTLAVVQMLLLWREHGDWGEAISRCPAMRCAPLRKYIRWLPPYSHLNGAARPLLMSASADPSAAVNDDGGTPQDGTAARDATVEAGVAGAHLCEGCGVGFQSRNALFRHLPQCAEREPPPPPTVA